MNATEHAAQAQVLIAIIAALIPLLIWAFRDAEQWFAAKRTQRPTRTDR